MRNRIVVLAAISFLIFLGSCVNTKHNEKIIIALSKGKGSEHYEQYGKWLEENSNKIQCVDLYYIKSKKKIDEILSHAAGIVLTGGPDVHPGRYGREFDTARCEIDPYRDTLEFYLIKYAQLHKIPILGICRGLQILNVAYGGTLFVDIPTDYGTEIIHRCDSDYCYHNVTLDTSRLLYTIMKMQKIKVNSYHHQGINKLAKSLLENAESDDKLIEGIELKNKNQFLIATQWHPERLGDVTSKRLARYFISECLNFYNKKIIQ